MNNYCVKNEKRIQNLLTEISYVKDKQSYALEEIKKDSESNNLIVVNKNNEITESLLARLDTMEIEMRKTKKINFILISIAIGLLILLSGFQIYFKQ
jgi:membrane-associated HD superfamily phosphohydrolase